MCAHQGCLVEQVAISSQYNNLSIIKIVDLPKYYQYLFYGQFIVIPYTWYILVLCLVLSSEKSGDVLQESSEASFMAFYQGEQFFM